MFHIPPEDEQSAARVYNMARTDVAGFEQYARAIRKMFDDDAPLCDLMEGLFHIAMADGSYHPGEDAYLRRVAEIFEFDDRRFRGIKARFVPDTELDAYDILGVSPDMPMADIRKAWRKAVRESHPDQMIARGIPEEAIKLAEARMVAINRAWEEISAKGA